MMGIIAFIAGYALLGFTCYVTMNNVPEWTVVHYHLWIIVAICYAVIFGSLLFSKFITKSVDERIGTWFFDWPARCLFVIILAVSAGLGFYIDNFNICYIIDGVAVFLYMLALVCSTKTTKHILTVQQVEVKNRVLIDEVRKASLSLSIVTQSLPDEFAIQKKRVEAIKEELRYLSPSSNQDAHRIEESILKQLLELKDDCIAGRGILPQRIALLNACIAERKTIY